MSEIDISLAYQKLWIVYSNAKKTIILFILLLLLLVLWGASRVLAEPKVLAIYKEADSFKKVIFIVLENAPTSNQAMVTFWNNNRDYLKTKHNVDIVYARSLLFLKDSFENYNKDSENQFCFH